MKVAIITPYFKEPRAWLERCISSVKSQTYACEHIVIADGNPQDWVSETGVRHIRLDLAHADYGNTPRSIGGQLAVAEGFDAVAFLDADNWYEPEHVEQCVEMAKRTQADVVTTQRHIVREDGSRMAVVVSDDADGSHVDTNCYFLLFGAFHTIPRWLMAPKPMAMFYDRFFLQSLREDGLSIVSTQSLTVNYLCTWAGIYRNVGEVPPAFAKEGLSSAPLTDWQSRLRVADLTQVKRLSGCSLRPSAFAQQVVQPYADHQDSAPGVNMKSALHPNSEIPQLSNAHYPEGSAEALLLALPRPVAVVGNGEPAREFGTMIDGYASVLRLNNYVIEGFEALVGRQTSLRVTSGWADIEGRVGVPELTPFAVQRQESSALPQYQARTGRTVAVPATDIGQLLPDVVKPSTGLSILALCSHLGIEVDAFGFDGFETGHYWDQQKNRSVHSADELSHILALSGVTLFGRSNDYASLYDFCHSNHGGYNVNEGLRVFRQMGLQFSGERVLEFGAGNGGLSAYLEQQGNQVTAMEVSAVALQRIPVRSKVQGDCLDLAKLAALSERPFDRFVSIDVLEHLTENDIRIVLRAAARSCRAMLLSTSIRPSGLLGPKGENLHLTVRPVQWWLDALDKDFAVTALVTGIEVGQVLFEGHSRYHLNDAQAESSISHLLSLPPALSGLGLPPQYVARPRPDYYVDSVENNLHVTWQPDVYPAAAQLARSFGCGTIIDIGCGHARKLVALAPEFGIIGVDYGPNIAHCRKSYGDGVWLEADFEVPLPLPIPNAVLSDSVVVCSDVIEHMIDPLPLLALLKQLVKSAAAVVLSTPDRDRTYGAGHFGPSPNHAHTREWTADELGRLLKHAGFDVAMLTHTRSNDARPEKATILALLVNREHAAVSDSLQVETEAPQTLKRHLTLSGAAQLPASSVLDGPRLADESIVHLPVSGDGVALGDAVVSVDLAREAVEQAPQGPDAWLMLAKAHQAQGNVDAFEQAMSMAFSLDQDHVGARRFLAALQLREGDAAEAACIYDQLLEAGHADIETIEGTVLAHWRAGDLKTAALRLIAHG